MLINCMKCKKQTNTTNEKIVKTANNRSRLTGNCNVCGTFKSKFVSNQKGKGDDETDAVGGDVIDNEKTQMIEEIRIEFNNRLSQLNQNLQTRHETIINLIKGLLARLHQIENADEITTTISNVYNGLYNRLINTYKQFLIDIQQTGNGQVGGKKREIDQQEILNNLKIKISNLSESVRNMPHWNRLINQAQDLINNNQPDQVNEVFDIINEFLEEYENLQNQLGNGITEYKASKEVYKKNPSANIDGYVLDQSLSKNKIKTYVNKETGKVIIAHKGTDPKDKNDIKNDLLLSVGLLNKKTSKRVRNANEITKKANEKYGSSNITHTGHSLGGFMADTSAGDLNKIETYNKGTSPIDIFKNKKKNPNAIHYVTGVDPISISQLASKDKTVVVKPNKLNVHSLSNFENLHKDEQIGNGIKKRGRTKKN